MGVSDRKFQTFKRSVLSVTYCLNRVKRVKEFLCSVLSEYESEEKHAFQITLYNIFGVFHCGRGCRCDPNLLKPVY